MPANNRQWFTAPDARLKVTRKTFDDGKAPAVTLSGYPIVWGATSSDRGGYKVRLAKSSANFVAAPKALWHHDFSRPLASADNGSLRVLPADDYGVPVEIDLDMNTSVGRDTAAYVESGLVTGLSFSMANGFEDYTEFSEGGQKILNAQKYTVDEVSVVTNPAFTDAQVGVKPDGAADAAPTPAGGMSERPATDRIIAAQRLASLRLANLKSEI